MITVHHLEKSQSDRIIWLLEELALPYEIIGYKRNPLDKSAPKEYLALHPAATSPIIQDGNLVLCESAAIVEYICNIHGDGRFIVKPGQNHYADYLYWMQFNNNALSVFYGKRAGKSIVGSIMERRENSYYGYLEHWLESNEYLAGAEFTCADIMAVFALTTLPKFGGRSVDDLLNVQKYLIRICSRQPYIKAMEIAEANH